MVDQPPPQGWTWPRLLAMAGLLSAIAGLLMLGDSAMARYQAANESCVYSALITSGNQAPALLVMGSSRVAHGFAPKQAGEALPEGRIIALGREFRGLGHVYATLADIPDGQWPAQIVLEFDPTAQSGRNPLMERLAPLSLLLTEALISQNNAYDAPYNAVADGVRLVTMRLADGAASLPRLLAGGRAASMPADTSADEARRVVDCVKHRDRTDAVKLAAAKGHTHKPDHKLGQGSAIPDAREGYWLERIISLSKAHGATLTLLHIPQYGQKPLSPRWRRAFTSTHDIRYIAPRGRVLQQMQATGYANPNHLNSAGAQTLTRWLMDELERTP